MWRILDPPYITKNRMCLICLVMLKELNYSFLNYKQSGPPPSKNFTPPPFETSEESAPPFTISIMTPPYLRGCIYNYNPVCIIQQYFCPQFSGNSFHTMKISS
jgi:hypothetical protein